MPVEGYSEFDDLVFGNVRIPNNELEDQILIKSDGLPTYNFANVVDDHLMEISYVMRGNEYLSSTPKYNLLYDAFGWEQPKYVHLTPIMKDATRKLSKNEKGEIIVNDKDKLVFFHFSGFDSGANLGVFEFYVKDK